MFHNFTFLINSIPYLFAAWVIAGIVHYARTKKLKFWKFSFCVKNYYWLLGGFLIYQIVSSFRSQSINPLIIFTVFALAGVIGEVLFSEWWKAFYAKSFWTYKIKTTIHSYTSLLNFLPWGIGGILFLNILNAITAPISDASAGSGVDIPFYIPFALSFLIGFLIQWVIFYGSGMKKFKRANLANYLFFIFPFLLSLTVCGFVYSLNFIGIAIAFGITASFFEYLFGKATKFFISKKLWTYNHLAIDNGHFTPLVLIPFSLAGFYFWGIGLFLESLLR